MNARGTTPEPTWVPGERVSIVAGPLRGMDATVLPWDDTPPREGSTRVQHDYGVNVISNARLADAEGTG